MSESSFEKISDKKIAEISELELADKISIEKRRSMEKYQVEIRNELLSLFENSYLDAMDEIDDFDKNISDKDFKKKFNFDMEKLRGYIDKTIPEIVEKINILSRKREIEIISNNSLRDVLSNALFNGLITVAWFKKNINSNEERVVNKIKNLQSGRRKALDNIKRLLDSEKLEYYFEELCANDDRLKKEAGLEYGYISEFSEFFKENKYGKNYPAGSRRLAYFKFFSELEKGKITRNNLNEELDSLDDEFINKEKIRKSNLIK